jgi:tRNA (Thr-GGU) A37 N-methylase
LILTGVVRSPYKTRQAASRTGIMVNDEAVLEIFDEHKKGLMSIECLKHF